MRLFHRAIDKISRDQTSLDAMSHQYICSSVKYTIFFLKKALFHTSPVTRFAIRLAELMEGAYGLTPLYKPGITAQVARKAEKSGQ